MQKKKKNDGGYSDTSSAGSFPDETDREVSSLTDRAFRSLCIGDEAVYNDSDLGASSPCTQRDRQLAFSQSAQDRDGEREELKRTAHESFSLRIWDKSALMSIQRELSEFSTSYQDNFNSGHFSSAGPFSSQDAGFYSSEVAAMSQINSGPSFMRSSHSKHSMSTQVNCNSNFFIHSEFSPFKVWRDHNRFPFQQGEVSGFMRYPDFPRWYETPMYKELSLESQPQVPYRFEERGMRNLRNNWAPVVPPSPPRATSTSTMLHRASAVEKRLSYSNDYRIPYGNDAKSVAPNVVSSNTSTTPFNISQLLTPVVHAHQESETSEVRQSAVSPELVEHPPVRAESRGATPDIRMSSYKSRATSLLFNLKDNRKRVKSTYSPTKFKGLETQDKNKQPLIQEPRDTVIDIPDFPDAEYPQVEESGWTNAVSHNYANQYFSPGSSFATNYEPAAANTEIEEKRELIAEEQQGKHREQQRLASQEVPHRRAASNERQRRAAQEEQQTRAAKEELHRKRAAEEEQKRRTAQEEQQRRAVEVEQQRKAAREEQQRRDAHEEQQRRAAQKEQERKAALEEEQKRAVQEELKNRAAQEEQQRRAAQKEQERKAALEEEQKRAAQQEQQMRAAHEEQQRRSFQEGQQRKRAAEEEKQRIVAQQEQERRAALEEQQKRAALEAQQTRAALVEQQRRAAQEEQQRIAALEEQQRRAAHEEQQRIAAIEEQQRRVAHEEQQRIAALEEQDQEQLADISEQKRFNLIQEQRKTEQHAEEQREGRQKKEERARVLEKSQATPNDEKRGTQERMLDQKEGRERDKAAQRIEGLQYYAITSTDSERKPKERQIYSPLPPQQKNNPVGPESSEDSGSHSRSYRPHAPASPAPSLSRSNTSSPALGAKPSMFRVKDNSFRGSSFIKSVKPRFHKSFGEDYRVGSPVERERREDEQEILRWSAGTPVHADRLAAIRELSTFPPGVESFATSAADLSEIRSSYYDERPESACSFSSDVSRSMGKPPTVPPKSEKALRRAKRLTSRRINKEKPKAGADGPAGVEKPLQDVRLTSCYCTRFPSHHLHSCCWPRFPHLTQYHVESSYPQSYPLTQRKVLQDLGSGQYFVVDVPVQVKTKTFIDPETGKYVQLNVRESAQSTPRPQPKLQPQPQQTYLQPQLQPQMQPCLSSLACPIKQQASYHWDSLTTTARDKPMPLCPAARQGEVPAHTHAT
uniref:DUF4585 domain-containing protein n=1 Tax=Labrus bergylta TaxID=56723 RepID=A0A3Q3MG02_9LABR